MRTLLLNSPTGHASCAFIDQKTTHPDQVPLLVTTIALEKRRPLISKQPVSKIKKIVSKMLTICSLFRPVEQKGSSKQPAQIKKIVSKMLTICSLSEPGEISTLHELILWLRLFQQGFSCH